MIIIALAVAVYTMVMLKKLKTNDKNQESGSSIYDPNAQGNKAKLEDPIPEQSKRAGKQGEVGRSDTGAVRFG